MNRWRSSLQESTSSTGLGWHRRVASLAALVCLTSHGLLAFGQDYLSSDNPNSSPRSATGIYSDRVSVAPETSQSSESQNNSEPHEPVYGFANGFVLASPDLNSIPRRDYPFSTRLSGWMQLRHAHFESDGPNRDRNAFSLERIRVGIDGHAYSPDLQYTFVLDANSDQAVQVSFLDAFVNYDFGRNLFDLNANQRDRHRVRLVYKEPRCQVHHRRIMD